LRSEGWDMDAYEPCSTARLPGVPVFGNLADLKPGTYDGIFTNDVLEHFQTPVETTRFLGTLLKPNGLLCHRTPCFTYCCEWWSWHVIFPLGRSVDILAERAGYVLVKRDGKAIVLRPKA